MTENRNQRNGRAAGSKWARTAPCTSYSLGKGGLHGNVVRLAPLWHGDIDSETDSLSAAAEKKKKS